MATDYMLGPSWSNIWILSRESSVPIAASYNLRAVSLCQACGWSFEVFDLAVAGGLI